MFKEEEGGWVTHCSLKTLFNLMGAHAQKIHKYHAPKFTGRFGKELI